MLKLVDDYKTTTTNLCNMVIGLASIVGRKKRETLKNIFRLRKNQSFLQTVRELITETEKLLEEISEGELVIEDDEMDSSQAKGNGSKKNTNEPGNNSPNPGAQNGNPNSKQANEADSSKTNADGKPDQKDGPDGKPDQKDGSDGKPDQKDGPDGKPDQKDGPGGKPDQKDGPGGKPDQKDGPDGKPNQKDGPGGKPDQKDGPGGKPDQKDGPGGKPDQKDGSDGKPDQKDGSDGKPDQKDGSDGKPNQKDGSDGKPNQKDGPDGKPDQKNGADGKPDQKDTSDQQVVPKEKKGKGKMNLYRPVGFLEDSFFDIENHFIVIDEINWPLDDIMEKLDTDDPEKVRFSTDVQTYLVAKTIDGRIYPELHIALKFRNEDSSYRNPHRARLFTSSICTSELVALLGNQKYNLGVPMNRTENHSFDKMNLNIRRSTVENWFKNIYDHGLKYTQFAYLSYLISCLILLMDETYMLNKLKLGNTYYWAICTSSLDPDAIPLVLFIYDESRSSLVVNHYLDGFDGKLLVDGYGAYPCFIKEQNLAVQLANCWKHWIRDVEKCIPTEEKAKSYKAAVGVEYWAIEVKRLQSEMFFNEGEWRSDDPDERLEKRKEILASKVTKIKEILLDVKESDQSYKYLPDVKKAVDYYFNHEKELTLFLEDGRIPLSTNELESLMNIISLGRNGWLAIETEMGGRIGGAFFSLVGSARKANVNVERYMNFVFESVQYLEDLFGEEFLQQMDAYIDEFYEVLEKAHEGKRKKENKVFHPEKMVNPKPDFSRLYFLFPNSPEHQAYCAIKEKEEHDLHQVIAKAVTLNNMQQSSLSKEQLQMIFDKLLARIKEGKLRKEYAPTFEYLKDVISEGTPSSKATFTQIKSYMQDILDDVNTPEDVKNNITFLMNHLTERQKNLEDIAPNPRSTSNITFPEDYVPEYLSNPQKVLERYGKMGYGCMKNVAEDGASNNPTPAQDALGESEERKERHGDEYGDVENVSGGDASNKNGRNASDADARSDSCENRSSEDCFGTEQGRNSNGNSYDGDCCFDECNVSEHDDNGNGNSSGSDEQYAEDRAAQDVGNKKTEDMSGMDTGNATPGSTSAAEDPTFDDFSAGVFSSSDDGAASRSSEAGGVSVGGTSDAGDAAGDETDSGNRNAKGYTDNGSTCDSDGNQSSACTAEPSENETTGEDASCESCEDATKKSGANCFDENPSATERDYQKGTESAQTHETVDGYMEPINTTSFDHDAKKPIDRDLSDEDKQEMPAEGDNTTGKPPP